MNKEEKLREAVEQPQTHCAFVCAAIEGRNILIDTKSKRRIRLKRRILHHAEKRQRDAQIDLLHIGMFLFSPNR